MKLLGMTFRPATSVKKSLYQGCLPVNVLHELSFFDKITTGL